VAGLPQENDEHSFQDMSFRSALVEGVVIFERVIEKRMIKYEGYLRTTIKRN
jgi:hypothetical protein